MNRCLVLAVVAAAAAAGHVTAQLPPIAPPVGNPITADKVNLGKVLFWDEQLSSTRTVACGTCHMPDAGGGDPRTSLGLHPGPDGIFGTPDDIHGSPGVPLTLADGTHIKTAAFGLDTQVTGRIAPSAINAVFNREQFWDGRANDVLSDPLTGTTVLSSRASLENQAANPPVGDAEMAHQGRDWQDVADRVAAVMPLALATNIPPALDNWIGTKSYPDLFNIAFGTPDVTPARILMAIGTYERVLVSDQTPFDKFSQGQTNALTPLQQAGLNVFNNQGRCNLCHAGALMHNFAYANIGVRPIAEDEGRFKVTGNPADRGAFKVPGLRNVGLRDRFFHNGGATSLMQVVNFYDRGGDFTENLDPLMQPLGLTRQEKEALVAFLQNGLTDPRVANRLPPFDRPTLYFESGNRPSHYGVGGAGEGGFTPRFIANEPPVLGNPAFTMTVADGLGGAQALLVGDLGAGTGSTALLGVPLHLAGIAPVLLPLGALQDAGAGEGYWSGSLAIGNSPSLSGSTIYLQAFVLDPAAPRGVSATEGLAITVFSPR